MQKKITRWVRNDKDKQLLVSYLLSQDKPFTCTIEKGLREKRSNDQNRLQRLWLKEAEAQGDMTAEEYRGYCKLHFGVPILRNECDTFLEAYDSKVKPYSYEQKLMFMQEPFDFPVTRIMTVKQKHKYLNMMYLHFTTLGIPLTIPSDIEWQPQGGV